MILLAEFLGDILNLWKANGRIYGVEIRSWVPLSFMSTRRWKPAVPTTPSVQDQIVPFRADAGEIAIRSLSDSSTNSDMLDPTNNSETPIPIEQVVLEEPKANFIRVNVNDNACPRHLSRSVASFGLHGLDSVTSFNEKGIRLDWEHLSVAIDGQRVLSSLSGFVEPGELFAIMGPSGCGKTTLLNTLSNQRPARDQVQLGRIFVDQAPVDPVSFAKIAAYVRQTDILMESLTPRESVNFVIDITKPSIDLDTRRTTTDKVLTTLGLESCADRLIGGRHLKGISGGERKRTSIAVELVTNPKLIFLDEPTSALDSSTAESVICSLRKLADDGRTIIASIHQPTHAVFRLFNRVLFLSGGSSAYFGAPDDAILYFSRIGYTLPPYTNPCEYFINLLSIHWNEDNSGNIHQSRARIETILAEAARQTIPSTEQTSSHLLPHQEQTHGVSWCHQLRNVCKRNFINYIRQPKLLRVRLIKSIVVGLLCGLLFTNIGDDQKSIRDRGGATFFLMLSIGMGSALDAVRLLPEEHDLATKEFYHLYHPSAYFISKAVTEMPFLLMQVMIIASISYPMLRFQAIWSKFGMFLFIMCLGMYTCDALGIAIGSVFPNPQVAAASASLIMMPLMVFSGFLVNSNSISVALRWIQYISPFKYALGALLINELDGLVLICNDTEYLQLKDGSKICPMVTGANALQSIYSLAPSDLWVYIWANGVIYAVLRIIGLFFVIYNSKSPKKRGFSRALRRRSR